MSDTTSGNAQPKKAYTPEDIQAATDLIEFLEEFGYDQMEQYPPDRAVDKTTRNITGTTLDDFYTEVTPQKYHDALSRGFEPFPFFAKPATKRELLKYMVRLHGANTHDQIDAYGIKLFPSHSSWQGFMLSLVEKITDGSINPPALDLERHPNRRTFTEYLIKDGDFVRKPDGSYVSFERETPTLVWRYRDATEGMIYHAFCAFNDEADRRTKGGRIRFMEEWIRDFLAGNRSFMLGNQLKTIEDITYRRQPITEANFRTLWKKVSDPEYVYRAPRQSATPANEA